MPCLKEKVVVTKMFYVILHYSFPDVQSTQIAQDVSERPVYVHFWSECPELLILLCICRSMKCQNMEGQTITILTLMISNALATKYSWIGRKGKMPFNLLAMSKIIIGGAA
ncbi:hypothetical protein JTB14_007148 [Gonioctena quinquepunctata]|nr:hypothetical protein JTB14_007148 [Gonioctena quinquepunctata]